MCVFRVHSHFPVAHQTNSNRKKLKNNEEEEDMYNFHLKCKLPLLVLLMLLILLRKIDITCCLYFVMLFFHIANLICGVTWLELRCKAQQQPQPFTSFFRVGGSKQPSSTIFFVPYFETLCEKAKTNKPFK